MRNELRIQNTTPRPKGSPPPKPAYSNDDMSKVESEISTFVRQEAELKRRIEALGKPAKKEIPDESPEPIAGAIVEGTDVAGYVYRVTIPWGKDRFLMPMLPGDLFEVRGRVVSSEENRVEFAAISGVQVKKAGRYD